MGEHIFKEEPLKPGDLVNDGKRIYEILELTDNEGGFGRIYKAQKLKTRNSKPIAIKEFHLNDKSLIDGLTSVSTFTRDLTMRNIMALQYQFENEIKMLYTLSRNIRKHLPYMYSSHSFNHDGRMMYAMEFINGDTLADCINDGKPYDEDLALEYTIQICKVLSNAHDLGVVHRDITPNNVIINKTNAILLDFGNAKSYDSNRTKSAIIELFQDRIRGVSEDDINLMSETENQFIYDSLKIGTKGFMAPPFEDEKKQDVYSIAALLYFMLTGMRPAFDRQKHILLVDELENRNVSACVIYALENALVGKVSTIVDLLKCFPSDKVFRSLLNF